MAHTAVIILSRGRRLLIALLQRTTARDVAARCRVYPQRVTDWASGYRSPNPTARRMLELNYGLPVNAWDKEFQR